MTGIIEGLLWFLVVLSGAYMRDAWCDDNWPAFFAALCVGGAFAVHLRNRIRAEAAK